MVKKKRGRPPGKMRRVMKHIGLDPDILERARALHQGVPVAELTRMIYRWYVEAKERK